MWGGESKKLRQIGLEIFLEFSGRAGTRKISNRVVNFLNLIRHLEKLHRVSFEYDRFERFESFNEQCVALGFFFFACKWKENIFYEKRKFYWTIKLAILFDYLSHLPVKFVLRLKKFFTFFDKNWFQQLELGIFISKWNKFWHWRSFKRRSSLNFSNYI